MQNHTPHPRYHPPRHGRAILVVTALFLLTAFPCPAKAEGTAAVPGISFFVGTPFSVLHEITAAAQRAITAEKETVIQAITETVRLFSSYAATVYEEIAKKRTTPTEPAPGTIYPYATSTSAGKPAIGADTPPLLTSVRNTYKTLTTPYPIPTSTKQSVAAEIAATSTVATATSTAPALALNNAFATTTATSTVTYISPPAFPPVVIGSGGSSPINSSVLNQTPGISLLGDSHITIAEGTAYIDPGATASDPEDGDLSSKVAISGNVQVYMPGDYTLRYNVSDSHGSAAPEATRIVSVSAPEKISTSQQEPAYALAPAGQETVLSVSSPNNENPRLVRVDINPLHVYVGDTQTLSATVQSASPITSVRAITKLDNRTVTLDLAEVSTDNSGITFSTAWDVFDTHVNTYVTTFIATNADGQSNSVTLAWSDPCSGVAEGTDSSLSVDCTVSTTDGLDGGTFTVPAGKTLTLNSGAQWVWNPGTAITIGGTIAIASGASLQKGYLYYSGSANDSADTSSKTFNAASTLSGYVRVGTYFKFTHQLLKQINTQYTSNTVTVGGIADGTTVTLSALNGATSVQMSINGGAWVTSGTINKGQTLAVRLTTGSGYSSEYDAQVTIGSVGSTFAVSTVDSCQFC